MYIYIYIASLRGVDQATMEFWCIGFFRLGNKRPRPYFIAPLSIIFAVEMSTKRSHCVASRFNLIKLPADIGWVGDPAYAMRT